MHMRETDKTRIQLKAMVMLIMTVAAMVLMFGFMRIVSHAEEGTVTATSGKIRAGADTSSAMIGSAMQGDVLTITGEVTGTDGHTWYQVTFVGDMGETTGYLRDDVIRKNGTGTTTPAVTAPITPASSPSTDVVALQPISAKVTGVQVNVRSNASTSGNIVNQAQKGEVLTVVGSAQDSQAKTWYQVTFTDTNGQVTGFIREDFVELQGELVPADQVVPEPEVPVEDPVIPADPVPAPVQKDFDTQLEEDGWYLLDRPANSKYLISELFETAANNKKLYDDSQAKLKSMQIIMIILVVAVILLALTATLLFFKIRDMMDAAYFEEVEKETIRTRQGQRSTGKASMPTVGASGRPAGTRSTGGSGAQSRPAGSQSQSRPAGGGQQSKPAGSGQSKPKPSGNGQPRPAGSSQQARPASSQGRPAQQGSAPRQQERTVSREQQNASRQSKNFMAEDDEFDFEYLNWDGEEDN